MATTVRGYFRRTKSGKQIYVRSYTRGTPGQYSVTLTTSPLHTRASIYRNTDDFDVLVSLAYLNPGDMIIRELAALAQQKVSESASKFSRSGRLADSFRIEYQVGNRADIVSDLPYAKTWLKEGNVGSPSAQSIRDWMDLVSSYNGNTDSQTRDIAWAIRYSLVHGLGDITGLSTLRKLEPIGERSFDYVLDAIRQIEPYIYEMSRLI